MKKLVIISVTFLSFTFLWAFTFCTPVDWENQTWLEPLDSKIKIKLIDTSTIYSPSVSIQGETVNKYRGGTKVDLETTINSKIITFDIKGIRYFSGPYGAGNLWLTFFFEITDLSDNNYTVKFIYDNSIDTYDLTVDATKFTVSPMSGSFTYFENTADMVYYK